MSLLMCGSSPHGSRVSPVKSICTAWNTYLSSEPAIESTPFMRKMSTPFSCNSLDTHALSRPISRSPACSKPIDVIDASCSCSESSRKEGSIPRMRSRSNACTPSTASMPTAALVQRMMGAYLLSVRSRASTRPSSSSSTRSILLSSSRSAKTTCSTASFSAPSGFSSSRCCTTCFASTSVMMPSRRAYSFIDSSMKKVCATGAGSAIPVVSMIIPSSFSLRLRSLLRMRIRSPRTVQHMHPLFISKISSLVSKRFFTSASSTPTSPNSFSITASFFP
mmetsp:Transcript_9361/g.24199  ORF Transcript_9361/g.24199 Transcript_9361/m.24199 type:complete len:278 (+) Transcript_9361:279-1112(+)